METMEFNNSDYNAEMKVKMYESVIYNIWIYALMIFNIFILDSR